MPAWQSVVYAFLCSTLLSPAFAAVSAAAEGEDCAEHGKAGSWAAAGAAVTADLVACCRQQLAQCGLMSTQKLIIFKHDSALGNAPAHKLFERVTLKRKDESKPPRDFSDYVLTIDKATLPPGIEIIEK